MFLLIDTAQEIATVALSKNGRVLFQEENNVTKEHAAWLHVAVGRLLSAAGISVHDLTAVAVIAGPGSYTGLRVGMAAAKGFCYALKIPLITQNTLQVMAQSMVSIAEAKNALICPMIDARRQEVFTALYSVNRQPSTINLIPGKALILDKTAFENELKDNRLLFFGSGSEKWKAMVESPNALFEPQTDIIQAFALLAQLDFAAARWADPVYAEPVYLKEFFSY